MEIKEASQLEKAKLEDTVIELLYSRYKDLVLHGGTSIWRCYSGNRFSRDLDFYMKVSGKTERMLRYRELQEFFKEHGFPTKEKGYNKATDTMHIVVETNAKMKIDVNFNYRKGIPVEYRKIDDSRIIVLSLSPLELLKEKIAAYKDKLESQERFKQTEIQDLYDMYYLTSIIEKPDRESIKELNIMVKRIELKPPPNASSLGHLMLAGLPPTTKLMLESIKVWLNAKG